MMKTAYLDVKLNLNDLSYMSYKKQNAKAIYNLYSSHQKNTTKQILNTINQLLNRWFSNKEKFSKTKHKYE